MSIEKTYASIRERFPNKPIDSLAVVKQVEEYRQFWRPREVKVVLLAESHVYTEKRDYEVKLKRLADEIVPNCPQNFVRFVYCLGYGENEILENKIKNNRGTPQYWKIFSSCVAKSSENEQALGFHRVLKTKTRFLTRRLWNKIDVLRQMQERGTWLLDASITGLYGSDAKDNFTTKKIIEICWQNQLAEIIKKSQPKHIIVIGKGVGNALHSELQKLRIPFTIAPQPQARENAQKQLENYKNYQRICAKYC